MQQTTPEPFPEGATFRDTLGPAMEITTQEEADAYFERLVTHTMSFGRRNRDEAEKVCRQNLGYWTGYYDAETAVRVFKLFSCSHPVFGESRPSAEEAFEAGRRMGEALGSSEGPTP